LEALRLRGPEDPEVLETLNQVTKDLEDYKVPVGFEHGPGGFKRSADDASTNHNIEDLSERLRLHGPENPEILDALIRVLKTLEKFNKLPLGFKTGSRVSSIRLITSVARCLRRLTRRRARRLVIRVWRVWRD
jgi:hypothetical protein